MVTTQKLKQKIRTTIEIENLINGNEGLQPQCFAFFLKMMTTNYILNFFLCISISLTLPPLNREITILPFKM